MNNQTKGKYLEIIFKTPANMVFNRDSHDNAKSTSSGHNNTMTIENTISVVDTESEAYLFIITIIAVVTFVIFISKQIAKVCEKRFQAAVAAANNASV